MDVRAIKDHIICVDGDFGDYVSESGIMVKSVAGQSQGIVPRWFKVYKVGPEIDFLEPGQWVLVEHGRWTDGLEVPLTDDEKTEMWRVDPAGCLAISDERPSHEFHYNSGVIPSERKV